MFTKRLQVRVLRWAAHETSREGLIPFCTHPPWGVSYRYGNLPFLTGHGTIHVTAAEPFFHILLYDAVTLRCPIVVPQILMNSVPIPIRILWLRLLISLYTSKSENPSPCHVFLTGNLPVRNRGVSKLGVSCATLVWIRKMQDCKFARTNCCSCYIYHFYSTAMDGQMRSRTLESRLSYRPNEEGLFGIVINSFF
ncbi:hypothetical protein IW262DRAFT_380445 [Armillaria fumosa]|nr:hypothetical protein IW262DRAFT_380445 [Armillaria fumosa]